MKENKGFTLIELIIVIVILSIVLSIALSIFIPMFKAVEQNRKFNEAKYVGDGVCAFIESKLIYAADVSVGANFTAALPSGMSAARIDANAVNGLYSEEFYNGMNVTYTVLEAGGCVLSITVEVQDSADEQKYNKTVTIKCINMESRGISMNAAVGLTGSPVIYYREAS